MRTPLTEAITNADCQGRFLGNYDMQTALGRFKGARNALEASKVLVAKADQLVNGAAQAVYNKYSTQMQGGDYAASQRIKENCAHDIRFYLRMVTYCLVAGGTGPMDDYLSARMAGFDEVNGAFELSPSCYVEALNYIKANHAIAGDPGVIANSYIDYASTLSSEF